MSSFKKIGLVCSAGLFMSMAFATGCTSDTDVAVDETQSNVEEVQAPEPVEPTQSSSYAAGQKLGNNINKATDATVGAWNNTSNATVGAWNNTSDATVGAWNNTSDATVGYWNKTTGGVKNWWDGVTGAVKNPTE
jgi:hypothetical protein